MRKGLRPPLLFLFLKTRKTKIIMGHFDELLAKKVGTGRIQGAGAPSLTVTTAGDGTCTLDGNDLAGVLTFANTWADGDTVALTFGTAKAAAPIVLITHQANINASGVELVEVDTLAVTATGFTITASGTAAGDLGYLVIEK